MTVADHPYNNVDEFEEIAQVYLGGYEWEIACVWRDKRSGRLYGDSMGGCSCYGPWEVDGYDQREYGGLGDLVEITHEREAAALLDGLCGEYAPNGPSTEQRQDFVRAVRRALTEDVR